MSNPSREKKEKNYGREYLEEWLVFWNVVLLHKFISVFHGGPGKHFPVNQKAPFSRISTFPLSQHTDKTTDCMDHNLHSE